MKIYGNLSQVGGVDNGGDGQMQWGNYLGVSDEDTKELILILIVCSEGVLCVRVEAWMEVFFSLGEAT